MEAPDIEPRIRIKEITVSQYIEIVPKVDQLSLPRRR